jgi:hypothetical protein
MGRSLKKSFAVKNAKPQHDWINSKVKYQRLISCVPQRGQRNPDFRLLHSEVGTSKAQFLQK